MKRHTQTNNHNFRKQQALFTTWTKCAEKEPLQAKLARGWLLRRASRRKWGI